MNKNPETELSNELVAPLAIVVKEGLECPACASGVAPMDPTVFGPALNESL